MAITARSRGRPRVKEAGISSLDDLADAVEVERARLEVAAADTPVVLGLLALQALPLLAVLDERLRVPLLTYGYFGSSAVAAVYLGARGARAQVGLESLQLKNALAAPFIASAWLFGLYWVLKYSDLDPSTLFAIVTTLFCALSAQDVSQPLFGVALRGALPSARAVDLASFGASVLVALGLTLTYATHPAADTLPSLLASNVLALCAAVSVVSAVVPESFVAAAVLACGLFAYDVFWVRAPRRTGSGPPCTAPAACLTCPARRARSCRCARTVCAAPQVFRTEVMQTVALSLSAPVKLQFPAPPTRSNPFSILGLGDIAVPGLLASMIALFEARRVPADGATAESGAAGEGASGGAVSTSAPDAQPAVPEPYLPSTLGAYGAALTLCFGVNFVTAAGQPALLYIVPSLLGTMVSTSAARGELGELAAFEYERPEPLEIEGDAPAVDAIRATQRWVREVVVPLSLCPYAREPLENDRYAYAVSNASTADEFIDDFLASAEDLVLERSADDVAATVLIAPALESSLSLDDYAALSAMLEEQCQSEDEPICDGAVGAAFFHPRHVFDEMDEADALNFERRAPFPCATLLRSADVGRIVRAGLAEGRIISKEIQASNARVLRAEGTQAMAERLAALLDN